jgi:hypothetical protein
VVGFLSKVLLDQYNVEFKEEVQDFLRDTSNSTVIGLQMRTGKKEGEKRFLDNAQVQVTIFVCCIEFHI